MDIFNTDLADEIQAIKAALTKADFILTGAGSGLSAASGLLYDDLNTFKKWFPGYYERYGLRTIS
ncbi:MAG: hypothetical protein LBQ88_22950, partial [Treponema sp.]|nr:hypothetical protein [Treponema sp.]